MYQILPFNMIYPLLTILLTFISILTLITWFPLSVKLEKKKVYKMVNKEMKSLMSL
uniref:ATP synthase subunit 8 n=1 Tax=Anaphothrips obscurus TaxID=864839 RepID=A0A343EQE7_9NEOP|nr:ATP synthase subunit 8 [Anaphothrips obscurus]ASJ63902.1 ATP synthase subunit 8 [Anaphothrips obscurus]